MASVANFKTSKYARDQWTVVRNKLTATGTDTAAKSPSPTKGPAKGTPGKRKKASGRSIFDRHNGHSAQLTVPTAASDNEADAVSPDETPAKKPKKGKKGSKAKVKQEPEVEHEPAVEWEPDVEPTDEQDASGDILAACFPEVDPTTG